MKFSFRNLIYKIKIEMCLISKSIRNNNFPGSVLDFFLNKYSEFQRLFFTLEFQLTKTN